MASWLLFLVHVLVDTAIIAFFARRAYNRGYDAGLNDSLNFSNYVDEVLGEDPPPRRPPPPPRP